MADFKYIKPEAGKLHFSEEQLLKMEGDYFECKEFIDEILTTLGEQNVAITWFDVIVWVHDFEITDEEKMWIVATICDYFAFLRARVTLLGCGCAAPADLVCRKCQKAVNTSNYTK